MTDTKKPWTDTETEHVIDTEYRDGKYVPVGRVIVEKKSAEDPADTVTIIEEVARADGVFVPVKVVQRRKGFGWRGGWL